ncbi:MAG: HEPN domain-containing protein [bacterium]
MNIETHIKHWIDSAEHDLPVADNLFKNGHYWWCLFVGHLVIEKILKAPYVKDNEKTPPKIHDLVRMAETTNLKLSKDQKTFLFLATTFNIEARYAEDKLKFFKICTKEFTETNYTKIKELYQWMKSQIQLLES